MSKYQLIARFFSIGILFSLAACTATQTTDSLENTEVAQTPQSLEEVQEQAIEIPERPLDERTMALLLEAEFALYRNDLERALSIYEQLTAETEDPGVARRSAEIAMAMNDPFRSLDAALYYLDLAPDEDLAIELAARALARSAEIEGAWALLNEHPEKTYELRMAAAEAIRLANQMQDNYQVEWLLENILAAYGEETQDTEIQLALGMIYESLGNFEQAAIYAEKANNARPENVLALRLRVRALLRSERNEEAATLLTDWILKNDDDPELRIQLAQTLAAFDPDAALPVLEILSEEYPWSGQLLMTTAQQFLVSDTPEKSIPYYQKLTQLGTFRAIAFFNLGRVYENQDELDLAIENYAKIEPAEVAEEDQDMLFEAQLRLGRLHYQLDQDQEGYSIFEKLRLENPDRSVALYHEEARILIDQKSMNLAIEILSQGLVSHPDTESLLYTRSLAYERDDQIDEAIADLRAILAFDGDNATALNALGYTLANRTDQYQEAYELIDRALSIEPEDPAIIDSMGWVLYHMGHYEQSLKYLQQAHEALLDEEVISHLAEVLWKLDRIDEAREILNQGIIDLPDSEMIPETRKRLGLDPKRTGTPFCA